MRTGDVKTYRHKDYTLAQIYVARDTTKVRKPRQVDVRGGQYLERWKKTSKNTKNTDLVFSDAGGRQIDKTYQYRAWKQWMDELGFDEDGSRNLTWYSLRHYGITMRIAAGNTYETVAAPPAAFRPVQRPAVRARSRRGAVGRHTRPLRAHLRPQSVGRHASEAPRSLGVVSWGGAAQEVTRGDQYRRRARWAAVGSL